MNDNGNVDFRSHFGQSGNIPLVGDFNSDDITEALLDRITHRALILNMTGASYRQR